jgi:hypothetical protein
MNKKAKILLGIIAGTIGFFALSYVVLCLILMQQLSSPVLATVPSPTDTRNAVLLLEDGFVDRGISLLVKSPSVNAGYPQRITPLDWNRLYSFTQLNWSQDGQLAVFSIRLAGDDQQDVTAFGFDFSTGNAILPPWQDQNRTSQKTVEEWKQHAESITALAEQHGGLMTPGFARENFRDQSKELWIWQAP